MFSRRALFGCLLAGLAVLPAASLHAERYANLAGLAPGRFVWSPTVAPSGPVTILVSLAERSVHVYRNGIEIGISNAAIEGDASAAGGVFLLSGIERDGAVAPGKLPALPNWRGTQLLALGGKLFGEPAQRVRIPHDFAELLSAASHRGACVVVAQQRSQVQTFTAAGPFVNPIETGSIDSVARFAMPGLKQADQAKPPATAAPAPAPAAASSPVPPAPAAASVTSGVLSAGEITSLIVSRADLSAYVMKDGRMVDRLPIAVQEPTQPFGTHAAVLVEPASAGSEARWLAVGLDDEATAPHVVDNQAEQSLRRVRFMDRGRTATLASELRAGTMIVLMDGHGPSATELARTNVALLSSDAAPSASASPASAARSPMVDMAERGQAQRTLTRPQKWRPSTGTAAPVSALVGKRKSQSTAADASSTTAPRRRKGPLDHREAWPESIYWPY